MKINMTFPKPTKRDSCYILGFKMTLFDIIQKLTLLVPNFSQKYWYDLLSYHLMHKT